MSRTRSSALANPGLQEVTVSLTLRGSDGSQLAVRELELRFYVLKSENFARTFTCPASRGWLRGCVQGMECANGGRRRWAETV